MSKKIIANCSMMNQNKEIGQKSYELLKTLGRFSNHKTFM